MQWRRHPLPIIAAAFVALAALYIWAIPPLEGSDEFEHFAYVTWLIEQRSFPIQGEAGWNTPVRQESGQPPLYYLLASLPARLAGTQPPVVFRSNPYFRYDLDPTRPDNKNTALHYPTDIGGGWLALYLARTVSVLSGVLLIVFVYKLAEVVLPDRPGAAPAAAAFTAFIPQVIFHSSHVSNDILATAFSTAALWQLARIVRFGGSRRRGLALGVALGLAALVKVHTLLIGLPIALGFGWLLLRRSGATEWSKRFGEVWVTTSGAMLGFIAVAGWWFVRGWLRYGSLLGLDTHCHQELSTCGPFRLVWPNWFAWRDTFRSFWAAFGLANIRPYDWVYWVFAGLVIMAAAGLGLLAVRRAQARKAAAPDPTILPVDPHLPILLLLLGSAVAGNVFLLYVWMQQILATYGRLLYPSLGAIVVLLIAGLWELRPRLARWAWVIPATLAVLAPFWLIRPAYELPRFLDEAALAAQGEPLGWRYGDVAELLSVTPATRSTAADGTLMVELCWRTLTPSPDNYTVYLQAVGPGETVVADRYTYPGLGSYPTAIWEPGKVFCDNVQLPIPADLPRTLVYRLSVGLLDDQTDERLPGTDTAGNPLPPFAGAVRLAARTTTPAEHPPPGEAAIRLVAAEFESVWQPGETQSVALRWHVAEAVPLDYTVFLHLRDGNNELVAQADGPPMGGWYPTSWWPAGEQVTDEHAFLLPDSIPPGTYYLVAGLYDPANGNRLGDEMQLGTVEIAEASSIRRSDPAP